MRKITVYSTGGVNGGEYNVAISATTLGQIKEAIGSEKYPWNTSVIADEFEKIYGSNNDILPEGDFALFIYPKTTKSGALSYVDAKVRIQTLRKLYNEAIEHFGNYTQKSTLELNRLVDLWDKKNNKRDEVTPLKVETTVVIPTTDDLINFFRSRVIDDRYYFEYTNEYIMTDINRKLNPTSFVDKKVDFEAFGRKLGYIK